MKNIVYANIEQIVYFGFALIVTASIAYSVSQSFLLV